MIDERQDSERNVVNRGDSWRQGELVEVIVGKAIYGGKMMGSAPDGRVAWLNSAEPLSIGDRVSARVNKVGKRSYEVQVAAVLEQGPDRVEPFCPHVARCGGCPWQAISLEQQLHSLERDISRMLSRALGEEVVLAPSYVAQIGGDGRGEAWRDSWRHTARLHVVTQRDGQISLGFFGKGGVFDLDRCPLFAPILNELLTVVRSSLLSDLGGGKVELRLSAAREARSGTIALSLFGEWSEERLSLISTSRTLGELFSCGSWREP